MAKRYWLVKSEPSDYSFDDLMNEEDGIAEWDGVRNYQARNNMQAMKVGDEVLFYHSQAKPTAVVGLAVGGRGVVPGRHGVGPGVGASRSAEHA